MNGPQRKEITMSDHQTESTDAINPYDEPLAPFLCLFSDLELFATAYDALKGWPPMKIGETDTHAIAAQLEALIKTIVVFDDMLES